MKILTVIGARPQFIKAAALSRAMKEEEWLQEKIIHTGQHYDDNMSEIFFEEMSIPAPDYKLAIGSGGHAKMTGNMMVKLEEVFMKETPDFILVYGDTNSTLAGALVGSKLNIPIIHIEAGLRSYNMRMPEEINRILTDRVASLLFCPTQKAVDNLQSEGFDNFGCRIVNVGDIMYDSALFYSNLAKQYSTIMGKEKLTNYGLVTVHRQENTDNVENLKSIILALNQINEDLPLIMPVHPRTRKMIEKDRLVINFDMIDPVGYFDMIELIKNSRLIFTDSGGLQKEAFFFRKYCLTLRDETEWTELVDLKVNTLVGASEEKIISAFRKFNDRDLHFVSQPYGDGQASRKIINVLREYQ